METIKPELKNRILRILRDFRSLDLYDTHLISQLLNESDSDVQAAVYDIRYNKVSHGIGDENVV